MSTTHAETKSVNKVKTGAVIKIVNCIPSPSDAQLGEMFLLISTGATDTNKLHIKTQGGWLKATLS